MVLPSTARPMVVGRVFLVLTGANAKSTYPLLCPVPLAHAGTHDPDLLQ